MVARVWKFDECFVVCSVLGLGSGERTRLVLSPFVFWFLEKGDDDGNGSSESFTYEQV